MIQHPTPLDAQVTPRTIGALIDHIAANPGKLKIELERAAEKARDFDRKYVIRRKP